MGINRRQFMYLGVGASLFAPSFIFSQTKQSRLLSCRSTSTHEHYFSVVEPNGHLSINLALPARGHGMAVDTKNKVCAVFARRPGEHIWLVDLIKNQIIDTIYPSIGRHFYGHGVFTPDGSKLLSSENAFNSGDGVIGIYDATNNYVRIGEFPSYGIGPHEIKLLNDGQTLVVANGGIRTDPDLPRIKTNLSTMRPNLAYINIDTGQLLHKHEPENKWHQLSIRHIAVSQQNQVAIAMQFEGKPHLQPPLVAIQQGEQPLTFLDAPTDIQAQLRNYCGSVTYSNDNSRFAVSSPRGGIVTYWSKQGDYIGSHEQLDACGICMHPSLENHFFVSDGTGAIASVENNLHTTIKHQFKDSHWDNHMLSIPV